MGQYWMPVNLDKKEFIDPHKLGCGLKLYEQLGGHVGTALVTLCAAHREKRGGGDLDLNPLKERYYIIAKRTIGRWAGDRIALVGDYAENDDLPKEIEAKSIFGKCHAKTKKVYTNKPVGKRDIQDMTAEGKGRYYHYEEIAPPEFTDVTEDVCKVIEHELDGKFTGDGWRDFQYNNAR